MNMTSISLSYFFLVLSAICLIFFIYFKIIFINTSEYNNHRNKIVGSMKNPKAWRRNNNTMSYIFLLWTIISFSAFAYIKYFLGSRLISTMYIIAFLAIMVVSIAIFGLKRKANH
ncbi:hypothetical protein [Candidatus Clostridium stratigraminis]|uniref:SdpI/YhfL protein family protein n=1 Tax=Candidatus Clostridium stratigraminis TaxID=3381661 RepID=A0ABW8T5F7_9CLOT